MSNAELVSRLNARHRRAEKWSKAMTLACSYLAGMSIGHISQDGNAIVFAVMATASISSFVLSLAMDSQAMAMKAEIELVKDLLEKQES